LKFSDFYSTKIQKNLSRTMDFFLILQAKGSPYQGSESRESELLTQVLALFMHDLPERMSIHQQS